MVHARTCMGTLSASLGYLYLFLLIITSRSQALLYSSAKKMQSQHKQQQTKCSIRAPNELREQIASHGISPSDQQSYSSSSALWDIVLSHRLSSLAGEEGTWISDDAASCVAHVIPDDNIAGRGRINLFHRGNTYRMDKKEQRGNIHGAIEEILRHAIQILLLHSNALAVADGGEHSDLKYRLILTFGSLDRKLIPYVRTPLEEGNIHHGFRATFVSQCGMWIHHQNQNGDETCNTCTSTQGYYELSRGLPSNVAIRSLNQNDAELVDSRWEYRSDGSLSMIRRMIRASEETYGGCVGLFVDDALVSWLCRYLDGTLGMLWTEYAHRKKGYAALVLMAAVSDIRKRSKERNGGCTSRPLANTDEPMVSYIVDSNQASQNLYKKLGWMRVADADWAGFASRKIDLVQF